MENGKWDGSSRASATFEFYWPKSNRTLLRLIGSTPLAHESQTAIRVDYRSTK